MDPDLQARYATWDEFLKEWPIERLRRMTLQEYAAAGADHTFIAWIEKRLDQLGSIYGGSAFKFGIYSRRDKSAKAVRAAASYSTDYAWYSKYGSTAEAAFGKVKSIVVDVAEAAARADYEAIDSMDLGETYKWKIAFHYQDRTKPGVVAVFKQKRLKAWLAARGATTPDRASELYRAIISRDEAKDILQLSKQVWEETAQVDEEPSQSDLAVEPSSEPDSESAPPQNLILYGPPGTGKTYLTVELAVRICDGVLPEGREALVARYRELRNLRRIRFVTFHPSFTYEEFVEGIRPTVETGQVRYEVRPGVFHQAATHARELYEARAGAGTRIDLEKRKLFKMSLGDSTSRTDDWIYEECLDQNYVCTGYGHGIDFSGSDTLQAVRERYRAAAPGGKDSDFAPTAVHYLKNELQPGNLVLVSDGNTRFRAIGEVTGPYAFRPREEGYDQTRPVRWLWRSAESIPISVLFSKRLSQRSIYPMDRAAVNWVALQELLAPKRSPGEAPNCVLVIDEINRANLAKTFGELITLLEPSKRLGQSDEQITELPYSGQPLGVPPNLYVLGTMNTADRSIALLDTALRRRFVFREMRPDAARLATDVDGINLRKLLDAMNLRIEALFDRDHILGHTYLMGVRSFEDLADRFRGQIIPLLQEYFFEDWRKIQQVFGDVDHPTENQVIQSVELPLDSQSERGTAVRYQVNPTMPPAAIKKIYS